MRKILLILIFSLVGCGDDSGSPVYTNCTVEKFVDHAQLICEDGTEIVVAPVEVVNIENNVDIEIKNCGKKK